MTLNEKLIYNIIIYMRNIRWFIRCTKLNSTDGPSYSDIQMRCQYEINTFKYNSCFRKNFSDSSSLHHSILLQCTICKNSFGFSHLLQHLLERVDSIYESRNKIPRTKCDMQFTLPKILELRHFQKHDFGSIGRTKYLGPLWLQTFGSKYPVDIA